MHRPGPAAPMGYPVMQIIAQIINDKTRHQSRDRERQHRQLIILRPIKHADSQKRRRAIGDDREQTHENTDAIIFGVQATAFGEKFYRQQLNGNGQKKYRNGSQGHFDRNQFCLLYTSPNPRDRQKSRMPSSA